MLAPPVPERPRSSVTDRIGRIEAELPNGARVCVDAFVNEKALTRVFRAMKGAV